MSMRQRLAAMAGSGWFFCTSLSALLVIGRLIFFDAEMFLEKQYIPSHDMLCAFPSFAMNVHSLRTTGELAWWNPIAYNGVGYANYYQGFLSPMAPTPGHVSFLAWTGGMRILRFLGEIVPEYTQYVYFTYVFAPFLCFLSFTAFARLLFQTRIAVILVAVAYAYSGIGLWISAWFYFQEPFTLFLVLASVVSFLRRPTLSHGYLMLGAVLIQIASINYWTIYNTFFYAVVAAGYAFSYPNRLKRAGRRILAFARTRRWEPAAVLTLFVVIAGVWIVLLGSMSAEQGERYIRSGRTHSKDEVRNRKGETRGMTVELFAPQVEKPEHHNVMHCARYVGIAFFPLLVLLPFIRWGRRERWLAAVAVGVMCVCMAPPFLVAAWKGIPFMDRVLHVFYFYSHYWQIVVVLLGGCVLDQLLDRVHMNRVPLRWGTAAVFGGAILCLCLTHLLTGRTLPDNPDAEMLSRGLLLLTLLGGLFYRLVSVPASRYETATLIVLIGLADCSRYFFEVSREDHRFTSRYMPRVEKYPSPVPGHPPTGETHLEFPLNESLVQKLETPWPAGDPRAGFRGGLDHHFPIGMEMWPDNYFLYPTPLDKHHDADPIWIAMFQPQACMAFYPQAQYRGDRPELPPGDNSRLQLDGRPIEWGSSEPKADTPFEGWVSSWRYNDFMLSVNAPTDGWLRLHLLYDPLWEVAIDGQRSEVWKGNDVYLTVPIAAGNHLIKLRYRPLARFLYPAACGLLVAGLALLGLLAWKRKTGVRPAKNASVTITTISLSDRLAAPIIRQRREYSE